MKRYNNTLLVLTLATSIPMLSWGQNNNNSNDALVQKAQSLAASNPAGALGAYELLMQQSIEKDRRSFGQAEGGYWKLVQDRNDFPRAYDFFSYLASSHPASADALGSQGSAIGGYLGWLASSGMAQQTDSQFVSGLDRKAHESFEQALKLDANNFGALFGYAIYETYKPERMGHARELFARLDALRSSHPEYPWQYVDQMKKQRLAEK
jgi:hypothetical protein